MQNTTVQSHQNNIMEVERERLQASSVSTQIWDTKTNDPMGTLIQACRECMCLEAGMCSPVFYISPYMHVCMTKTWMSQCWYQCVQCGIFISMDIKILNTPPL